MVRQKNFDLLLPGLTFQFGNAILSRYPVTNAKLIDYPAQHEWERWLAGKKSGVWATLNFPGGERVDVVAVHLEHRDESTRADAAELLLEIAERPEVQRLVLAGDFNSTPTFNDSRF